MPKYKLIAIDSSSKRSGVAIYENAKLSNSFVVDYSSVKDDDKRIWDMLYRLFEICNAEKPGTIVVEQVDVVRNAKTNRQLNMIVGAILGYCVSNSIEFVQLKPTVWRKLISTEKKGRKREELKRWAIAKVAELFDKTVEDDEADAILLGQARINMFK